MTSTSFFVAFRSFVSRWTPASNHGVKVFVLFLSVGALTLSTAGCSSYWTSEAYRQENTTETAETPVPVKTLKLNTPSPDASYKTAEEVCLLVSVAVHSANEDIQNSESWLETDLALQKLETFLGTLASVMYEPRAQTQSRDEKVRLKLLSLRSAISGFRSSAERRVSDEYYFANAEAFQRELLGLDAACEPAMR